MGCLVMSVVVSSLLLEVAVASEIKVVSVCSDWVADGECVASDEETGDISVDVSVVGGVSVVNSVNGGSIVEE